MTIAKESGGFTLKVTNQELAQLRLAVASASNTCTITAIDMRRDAEVVEHLYKHSKLYDDLEIAISEAIDSF